MEGNIQNVELETLLEYDSSEDFSDSDRQVTNWLLVCHYLGVKKSVKTCSFTKQYI